MESNRHQLPPEFCQSCGKEISRRARANICDDRILCTACWRVADAEKRSEERSNAPASPAQVNYATDLGLSFPPDVTWQEMHDILSRHLDFSDDPIAPDWVVQTAKNFGVEGITRFSGRGQLYSAITRKASEAGDETLATWFAYNVAREVSPAVGTEIIAAVATELSRDESCMNSIKRYSGVDLFDFGISTDRDGTTTCGASNRTIAYREARRAILFKVAGK